MKVNPHVAILSAMPEEVGSILKNLIEIRISEYGDLTINSGIWIDPSTQKSIYKTTAWSGWGKVSAARAATRIISSS